MFRTVLLLVLLALCTHAHEEHSDEPPHFKYSREANTQSSKGGDSSASKHTLRMDAPQQLWLETGSAIILISVAPFLLLVILPDLNKYQGLLKILLAFAAGGLLGDAFLHLIPHAIDSGHQHQEEGDSHNHEHHSHEQHDHSRHMMVGLSVVAGIFIFLCIEKFIRLLQHGNSHGHSHSVSAPKQPVTAEGNQSKSKKNKKTAAGGDEVNHKRENKKQTPKVVAKASEFKVTGYLNLAADFTHNFTDGLAIGASFLISRNVGMVTTMTVLLHELPHEIGDYAILIRSGCSARKAMFLQLLTAIGAALGAFLSLAAAGVGLEQFGLNFDLPLLSKDVIAGCILPFTAGGFIYIAMTSVLPDLLSTDEPKRSHGFFARMAQSVIEVLAMVGGIGMMAALGAME